MKSLVIFAHPGSDSLSHLFAHHYAKAFPGEADIINLYDKEWRQDYLEFEDVKDLPEDPVRKKIQQKILETNELTFIFPIWWGYVPAILKNFFDQNLEAGFAYRFHKGGSHDKLLKGRTAKVIATSNGPKWIYALIGFPFFIILKYITLDFCGIKVKKMKLFDKAGKRSPEEIQNWVKKVEAIARKG